MLINTPSVLACGIHFPSAANSLTKPFAVLSLLKSRLILALYSVNHLFVLAEKAWQSLSELIGKVATLSIFRFLLKMSFYDVMTVTQADLSIKLFTVLLVLPIPPLPFHVAGSLPCL